MIRSRNACDPDTLSIEAAAGMARRYKSRTGDYRVV